MIDTFFLESKIWYDGHESFNNNLSFLADCSSNKLVGNFFVLAILSSDERENVKNLKLKTACKGQAERKCL